MGLFTKNDSREILDKYLKKYINEDILFDGKKKDDEDEKEEENNKSKKGITLLTLVITVIVLLILTGITISATYSNNGILNYSLEIRKENAISVIREESKNIILGGAYTARTIYT
jgi:hypothetical protein